MIKVKQLLCLHVHTDQVEPQSGPWMRVHSETTGLVFAACPAICQHPAAAFSDCSTPHLCWTAGVARLTMSKEFTRDRVIYNTISYSKQTTRHHSSF